MFRCLIAAGMTASAAVYTAPVSAEPLTSPEMRKLSAHDADVKVRRDLLSLLQPSGKLSSGMLRQFRGVSLTARPTGTAYEGICEQDRIEVKYAPFTTAELPEHTPLVPHGVSASASFHIFHLPKSSVTERDDARFYWQQACDRLGKDTAWISAESATDVVVAAKLLERVVEGLKAGRQTVEPCGQLGVNGKPATCAQAILEVGEVSRIGSVSVYRDAEDVLVYRLDFESRTGVTIAIERQNDTPVETSPIRSVKVEQYIVVT